MSHDAAEELAKLVEETERVVRQAEDVRVRIAKRRSSSDEIHVEPGGPGSEPLPHRAASESDKAPQQTPSERVPCLDTVSRLLPSLSKARPAPHESGVYSLVSEPGRYAIIAPRRDRTAHHADLPVPAAPKSKISA